MTPIQTFRSSRARALAGVALSVLCGVAISGAAPVAAQTPDPAGEGRTAIAHLAEQAEGSVVAVTVTRSATGLPRLDLAPDDDVLGEFLRRFGEGDRQLPEAPLIEPEQAAEAARATGSGFVTDPEGLIVTADALVAEADRIEITLPDGSVQAAEIVGRDTPTGLALLRIEVDQDLPALPWGTSTEFVLGEDLLAVGRVEGFGPTLSTGVLAARSTDDTRLLLDDALASAFIGAPVLDSEGRVVAVWTGAEDNAQTGGTVALASDVAREVVDELARSGTVARGYLGVQIQPVTADIAAALGLDRTEGAMVAEVRPGTPAAEAGLQAGDVILAVDGDVVSGPEALSTAIARLEPGEDIRLEVWRDEEVAELTATLAALPGGSAAPDTADAPQAEAGEPVPELALMLQALTPDLRDTWGLSEAAQGVAVLGVEDPEQTDIQEGDVIVSVQGTAVETVEDVRQAVEAAAAEGRSSVLLLIDREGTRTFVAVPLAQT